VKAGWVRIIEYEGQEWKTKGKNKSRGLKDSIALSFRPECRTMQRLAAQ
jgi:hypothetical protein